jgi:hypothetical protein
MIDAYDAAVQPARRRFATSEPVLELLGRCDRARLTDFTMRYLEMQDATDEMLGTFRRAAANRCVTSGHVVVGHAMVRHAREREAVDHTFAGDAEDLAALLGLGRSSWPARARTWDGAMRRHLDLHATAALGDEPWRVLAIGHELERLVYGWGWPWMQRVRDLLGPAAASCLAHTNAGFDRDACHVAVGRRLITRLLAREPEALLPLIAAGIETLDVFTCLLSECLTRG